MQAPPPLPGWLVVAWHSRRPLSALRRLLRLRQCLQRNGRLLLCGLLWSPQATLNGRQYRHEDLQRELAALPPGCLLRGAFGHPPAESAGFSTPPPLSDASHQLAWHAWRQGELHGTLELLDTATGRKLLQAFLAGHAVGASLRGFARLHRAEGITAAADLQLVCFDVVEQPASRARLEVYSGPAPEPGVAA